MGPEHDPPPDGSIEVQGRSTRTRGTVGDGTTRSSGVGHGEILRVVEMPEPEATTPLETWTLLGGTGPWTRCYVMNWRPGDVMAVGPRRGTRGPPFHVCGSDQWVAGYTEGQVRAGRDAAAAALAGGSAWTSG